MKQITWLGNTHQTIKGYSDIARQQIGYNLDKVQRGLDPYDWKPMVSVGQRDIGLAKQRYAEMIALRRTKK